MGERYENEAALFVRYEARIVALELAQEELSSTCARYWPIVDDLRDSALVATKLAEALGQQARTKLTKVHIALGIAALFMPAIVGSLLTALLVGRHP